MALTVERRSSHVAVNGSVQRVCDNATVDGSPCRTHAVQVQRTAPPRDLYTRYCATNWPDYGAAL